MQSVTNMTTAGLTISKQGKYQIAKNPGQANFQNTAPQFITYLKQEAQLQLRNSASAAHMDGGLSPPVHSPSPSGYTYAYGRIRNPQQTYVKRALRKAHFKLNRAFKVYVLHIGWNIATQVSRLF